MGADLTRDQRLLRAIRHDLNERIIGEAKDRAKVEAPGEPDVGMRKLEGALGIEHRPSRSEGIHVLRQRLSAE